MKFETTLTELFTLFEQFQELTQDDRAAIAVCTRSVTAVDGEVICRSGTVCPEFFYVHSSITRAFYLPGDESTDQAPREITGWLSFPGTWPAALRAWSPVSRPVKQLS